MLFMNEMEIDEAVIRYRNHPVLSRAAQFLAAYKNEVNDHSDGWPYWADPVRAAKPLIELFHNPGFATEDKLRKALTPIRSFYTRRGNAAGMSFPNGII